MQSVLPACVSVEIANYAWANEGFDWLRALMGHTILLKGRKQIQNSINKLKSNKVKAACGTRKDRLITWCHHLKALLAPCVIVCVMNILTFLLQDCLISSTSSSLLSTSLEWVWRRRSISISRRSLVWKTNVHIHQGLKERLPHFQPYSHILVTKMACPKCQLYLLLFSVLLKYSNISWFTEKLCAFF